MYKNMHKEYIKNNFFRHINKQVKDSIDQKISLFLKEIGEENHWNNIEKEKTEKLAINFGSFIMSLLGKNKIPSFLFAVQDNNYDSVSSRINFLLKKANCKLNSKSYESCEKIMNFIENKFLKFQKEEIKLGIKCKKIKVLSVEDSEFKESRDLEDWHEIFDRWIHKDCKNQELKKYAQRICDVYFRSYDGWYSLYHGKNIKESQYLLSDICNAIYICDRRRGEVFIDDLHESRLRIKSREDIYNMIEFLERESKALKSALLKEKDSDLAVIMTYIHNMTKFALLPENKRKKIDLNNNLRLWGPGGPILKDIEQQDLGDCYFEAVLKTLVSSYDFRKCFVDGVTDDGRIEKGKKIKICLHKVKVTGNDQVCYAQPSGKQIIEIEPSVFLTKSQEDYVKENQVYYWPYVLLKAYSIMRTNDGMIDLSNDNDYLDKTWKRKVRKITDYSMKFINGGLEFLVQCALTGRKSSSLSGSEISKDIDKSFCEISSVISNGGSVTASFNSKYSLEVLTTKHAYAVVKVSDEDGEDYIYLEDPRGKRNNNHNIAIVEGGLIRMNKQIAKKFLDAFDISE